MIEISCILALFYALICASVAMAHSITARRMTLLDWSLLAAGGMYGFGWIVVLLVTAEGNNPTWEAWISPFPSLYIVHTAAALLLLGGILFGWYLPANVVPLRCVRPTASRYYDARPWAFAFWVMLLLAVLTQGLYTRAYGGYIELLEYSASIRSASFSGLPDNPLSFLKPFGGLALFSAYGFFGLWLVDRRKIGALLGFALAFVFSLYVLYSWLGRINLIAFLGAFFIAPFLSRKTSPLALMAVGAMMFLGVLFGAYGVSHALNVKAAASIPIFFARELSFPFVSFFAQWTHGEYLFLGFADFLLFPIYLLPSSLWTNWIEPVGQINTAVIMGAPKGEGGITGGIPTDLLTLGLMQSHVLGVVVVGAMFGTLLRFVQRMIDGIPLSGVRGAIEAYVALKVAALGVFYAQPNLVISGNIYLIAGGLIISAVFISLKVLYIVGGYGPGFTRRRE